jgi:hypothetical protein
MAGRTNFALDDEKHLSLLVSSIGAGFDVWHDNRLVTGTETEGRLAEL